MTAVPLHFRRCAPSSRTKPQLPVASIRLQKLYDGEAGKGLVQVGGLCFRCRTCWKQLQSAAETHVLVHCAPSYDVPTS